MENKIYVVCWFDGNKAIAMAGTRNSEGKVSPLAVERRNATAGSIANGVIALSDENRKTFSDLSRCVANLLTTTLNETYSVQGFYVVAMPRSMRSVVTSGEKILDTRRYVTDRDIEDCRIKAREEVIPDCDVLSLYENGFNLDSVSTRHANGEVAKKLRMNALSVIVNKRFSTDYRMLLPKDVTLSGVLPASVAASMAVTTPDERFDGVVSVHFCNSTTLFTAYSDDRVVATCVVPFGEEDVIHDLCSGVCENSKEKEAVWRKIYDKWNFASAESDLRVSDSLGNKLVDAEKAKHMSYAAETRISEIFNIGIEWLRNQLADFDTVTKAVVFSGLISDKAGFSDFASSLAPDSTCRCGNANDILLDHTYGDDPDYIPMIGAMLMATEGCVEIKHAPVIEPVITPPDDPDNKPKEKTGRVKKPPFGFINDLFNGKDEDL